jgi:tripartite-type tricarboxylate transporter receptor subunit TctC
MGKLAACLTAAVFLYTPARAEPGYPNRAVTIMVPYGAGGMGDVVLRLFAERLAQRLGQQFVIENRPGGGGAIAAQATLARPANGYTLFFNGSGMAIAMSLFKIKPFDLLEDFKQIATVAVSTPLLLATGRNSGFHSIQDIVTYGRAKPGKLTIGTINPGSTQNLTGHLFQQVTGIEGTVVTYRATPELITALIRGDVDFGIDYYAAFQPVPDDTRIRILATTGEQRSPLLAEVPTLRESGYPDLVVTTWNGLSAPKAVSHDVVKVLNRAMVEIAADPDLQRQMLTFGLAAGGTTPEEMTQNMTREIEKWSAVIEKAGIALH